MKILIVEDIKSDRALLRLYLERHGEEVIEARNGKEGLEMARTLKPDIIISDVLMPVMDGFNFLKTVREDPALEQIPFVFYSATYTEEREMELAYSLGACCYIVKGKDPEEFWTIFQEALRKCTTNKCSAYKHTTKLDDNAFLKDYCSIVATKLEKKMNDLETTRNRLVSTQERLDHILSYSPACIFSSEPEPPFITTFISPNVAQILGYEAKEFLEDPNFWISRLHPDDLKMILSDLPQLKEQGRASQVFRFRHKDSAYRWMLAEVRLLKDETGIPIEIIGFWTDITERKLIEEALKESEERFKTLFDTILDGVYQTDEDNRFSLINNSGARIFGYESPDEMTGRPVADFWADPQDREVFLKKLRLSGSLSAYPLNARKKDGRIIHIEITCNILRDENGNYTGTEGIIRDVTERKKLEEQFIQAQKMEAVGHLAGGIAHDFNNFLTAIIGYASIMQVKLRNEDPLMPNIDMILASAEKAANLTASLLAFGRKQIIDLKPTEINSLIRQSEKLLRRMIREDIELRLMLCDKDLIVMADGSQLEQALMNLTTNARDAMPAGGALIIETRQDDINEAFVSAHGYGKPGRYAVISVSDTGKGMDTATREKIFEPFFTTKELGKGTGLGLSMVYGLLKQHNGFIDVYSELTRGTTFKIYLPLIIKTDVSPAVIDAAPEAPIARGTENVLLAEDNAEVREFIGTVLKDYGYNVFSAVDGEDAINRFLEHRDRIDIVILDVIMPKINGKEVYKRLAGIKPGLKVIFTSGYTADIIHLQGILERDINYLAKPISPNSLLRKVREVLDNPA